MIRRVISGGQTGVDRAALDVALELGIECGGWCPKGRRAEDGHIPGKYPLMETPARHYAQRTQWNVRDADATLILCHGTPRGGTAKTADFAEALGKPYLMVDLDQPPDMHGIRNWLDARSISTLNIAGPRESQSPGIYAEACELLRQLFRLQTETGPD